MRVCRYVVEAGDTVFAPAMKVLLLRTVILAWHRTLSNRTRREYRRRLERHLDAVMAWVPTNPHGLRFRKRYGKLRKHLFTFLEHPDVTADKSSSERELRPIATYRKVTGGFRSNWGAECYAAVRSVIGTARKQDIDAYQNIHATIDGSSILEPS